MRSPLRLLAILPVLAALGATLAACGPSSAAAPQPTAYAATGRPQLPTAHGPADTIIYSPFTQRLVRFDQAAKVPEPPSAHPNWFQYEFPTPSELYTSGSSTDNGFSIIRVNEEGTTTVATMAEDEGVFPLATDGTRHFFLVSRYDEGGRELSRRLAALGADGLVPYAQVTGLVDSGAVLADRLYFTVFDEAAQAYSLHSVSVRDPSSAARPEKSGLRGGKVLAYGGRLWTSDGTRISDGTASLPCTDLCYFVGDRFLTLHVGASNGLALDVHDPATTTLVETIDNAVAFRPEGKGLRVFGEGFIKDVALGSAS